MKTREVRTAVLGVAIVLGAFLPLTVTSAPKGGGVGSGQDYDALTAARFELTVEGITFPFEFVGIGSGYDRDALQVTPRDELVVPPTRTAPTLILKRGKSPDLTMWSWHIAAMTDPVAARKSCSLVMFNTKGDPVARYHLTNAWPAKMEIGALKAGASEVLVESLTLVAERIDRLR